MLQIVILSSIENLDIVSPRYSITVLVAPAVPIWRIRESIMSLAVIVCGFLGVPMIFIAKVFGLYIYMHLVYYTCLSSLVIISYAIICIIWLCVVTITTL